MTWLRWESPICAQLANDCARELGKAVHAPTTGQSRVLPIAKRSTVKIAVVIGEVVKGFGTGVIVSPSGLIVTAAHVVAKDKGDKPSNHVYYPKATLEKMIAGDNSAGVPQLLIGLLQEDENSTKWQYRARLMTSVKDLIALDQSNRPAPLIP